MELIPESVIANLLQGSRVTTMAANGDLAATGHEASVGTWSFPFALMALGAILAAVILAWAMDRPKPVRTVEAP
jgi:hypothetical protein